MKFIGGDMYDEPFVITYDGVIPDDQLKNYIKFWMYSILDYCPYDSYIKVHVLALTNRFLIELEVKSVHEHFFSFGEEDSIEAALETAEQSLYAQIKHWRKVRFADHTKPQQKLSVLVVDDDPISTKLIEACLQEQGCDVFKASSGEEAIFTFKSRKFNFVVMDWNMRPLSGRQTLKLLDSNININKCAQRTKLPVITYTSNRPDQVSFPRTENLYQYAYLSKTSTFKTTFETTKKLVDQYNVFH